MKKILVVEDDKFLRTAYKTKFTKAGFEVQSASDGDEALKALKTFTPNVIILDLVMPVKDGFQTLEELNKDENLKKIPVIVASNLGQKEDTQRAKKLGARDFFVKSDLSFENIIKKINSI